MPDHLILQSMFNQAIEAMDRGEYGLATQHCLMMLEEHRNDLNAITLLAKIANELQQFDQAIEYCRRLLKAQPKDAEFRSLLGRCYTETGRFSQALIQFDRALKIDPNSIDALAGKGEVYERQGKYDRALKAMAPLLADPAPNPAGAHVCVRVLTQKKEFGRAIDLARRSVDAHPHDSRNLRHTQFALARAYELNGDYDESFTAAKRANEILAVPFDADANRRRLDKLMEVFSPERLAKLPRPAVPTEIPIFIAALPRSGTTLIERIIQAHPAAYGVGESPALQSVIDTLPERIGSSLPYPECIDDLTQDDVDTLAQAYLDEITKQAPRAERITDKELANFLRLGLISVLFPKARIIHCRRDPIDNCLSCYMGRLVPSKLPFTSDLKDLGRYYRQHERVMRYWKETLDMPILEVDYEAVVEDQEGMTRRIIEFCGLPWDDACLKFYEAKRHERTLSYDQVNKPIYKSSVNRAERFGSLLDPLRQALADEPE